MERIALSKKGLYVGTGVGLILFVLVGLLSGSLVGGMIGLKIAGLIFGGPVDAGLFPRLIVAGSMMVGVVASAVMFVAGMGFLGWAGGFVLDATLQTGSKEAHAAAKGR